MMHNTLLCAHTVTKWYIMLILDVVIKKTRCMMNRANFCARLLEGWMELEIVYVLTSTMQLAV